MTRRAMRDTGQYSPNRPKAKTMKAGRRQPGRRRAACARPVRKNRARTPPLSRGASRSAVIHKDAPSGVSERSNRARVKAARRREAMAPTACSACTMARRARFSNSCASASAFSCSMRSTATAGVSGASFSPGFGPNCSMRVRMASTRGATTPMTPLMAPETGSSCARRDCSSESGKSVLPSVDSICSSAARVCSSCCAAPDRLASCWAEAVVAAPAISSSATSRGASRR
jgi:hypothetical protein